jgi:penicillin amidase
MPGIPAMVIGRTNDLAWGVTYSFMDAVDSWIEDCRDGKFRRGQDEWIPFTQREETVKRKGKKPVSVTFYENDHGLLDGDPNEKGYYLATRWSTAEAGAVSLNSFYQILDAANVKEGMDHLGKLEVSFNWGMADREGNIGYQMSGLMPKRREGVNGFIPLKGWDEENDWKGYHPHTDLPRSYNPEEGYIATANNNLNHLGKVSPITVSQTEYRVERIKQLLSSKEKLAPEDCFKYQNDVYSLQAERFMKILRPFLPDTPQGEILKNWDYAYPAESEGAFLFEEFYEKLFLSVFGENGLGKETVAHLQSETGIFTDFFKNFDDVILSKNSLWFNGKDRDEIFSEAAREALNVKPRMWGASREYSMTNMFFGGKLPKLFGFDGGPVKLRGGRATVQQGQIFRAAGRRTSFCPSFRMVIDLADEHMHTALAGGPSDRRFSKWYKSGLDDWVHGKYKKLSI